MTSIMVPLATFGGIVGLVGLFISDNQPIPTGSAYAALSEVEDSPIEDVVGNKLGVIERGRDGLFHATLTVNDHSLRCIVDTGATATVLSVAEIHRIGLTSPLHFNGHLNAVGGDHQAARERLDEVAMAGHSFRKISAFIVKGTPTPCLVGSDLLARLDAVEMHGDKLILR